MAKDFLGVGWSFPIKLELKSKSDKEDKEGLGIARYEDSVRQSIWTILGTAKGERVMRPDFGCGIYDLVFETNDDTTAGRITEAIREALLAFEPRIDVKDVQVRAEQQGEVMLIIIDYSVRATNNAFNVVYPFYLERGAL
ncbi:baseplate protein [Nitrosomonas sp. PY1]|uniref:GPW/gp25 family protein n=1 Tax=Nitrosomonas sp. PY1 TaxID=1803906 RepID=UPI001FC8D2C4|nr:GPW/gp25 family protein [Nitrosomonas sp. PY1]GKS69034.1 baseplate protein [Nitrosomonas sp. PY1]